MYSDEGGGRTTHSQNKAKASSIVQKGKLELRELQEPLQSRSLLKKVKRRDSQRPRIGIKNRVVKQVFV